MDPDTGNTVDLKVMIHKIHKGEALPSVKVPTIRTRSTDLGPVNDFSTVAFPQDIRHCVTCHNPDAASQAANWYTYPSLGRMLSLATTTWTFTPGGNHAGGPQADDSHCAQCHQPQGVEFDASIMGAHTVPLKSTQLKGLNAGILSVANAAPGQAPMVTFRITENDGTVVAPASLGTNLNILMGGPTTDYAINPFREQAQSATVSGDQASYTMKNPVPADASGTWAFSIEARRTVTLNPPAPDTSSVTEAAFNPVFYSAASAHMVTVSDPAPRRQVVDLANCNKCHDRLALHGGQRLNTEECVICHNPNASDVSRRPSDQLPVESIDFKRMIHRIHTGEELTQDFTIYGFGTPPA